MCILQSRRVLGIQARAAVRIHVNVLVVQMYMYTWHTQLAPAHVRVRSVCAVRVRGITRVRAHTCTHRFAVFGHSAGVVAALAARADVAVGE